MREAGLGGGGLAAASAYCVGEIPGPTAEVPGPGSEVPASGAAVAVLGPPFEIPVPASWIAKSDPTASGGAQRWSLNQETA